MQKNFRKQLGASLIVTLIGLAIIGYGIFIGIQYVPQFVEARSVQAILDEVQQSHRVDPINDQGAAKAKVVKMLQVNELNDMTDKFKVTGNPGNLVITFS